MNVTVTNHDLYFGGFSSTTNPVVRALRCTLDDPSVNIWVDERSIVIGERKYKTPRCVVRLLRDFAKRGSRAKQISFKLKPLGNEEQKNPHAVALGQKGGKVKSRAKRIAARKNGKRGGRPLVQRPARAKHSR